MLQEINPILCQYPTGFLYDFLKIEKFTNDTHINQSSLDLAKFIVISGKFPEITKLIKWLCDNLPKTQYITICEWVGSKYYILIDYKSEFKKLKNVAIFGLTIDLQSDSILWNNNSFTKGVAFVRNLNWERKMKEEFKVYPGKHYSKYSHTS